MFQHHNLYEISLKDNLLISNLAYREKIKAENLCGLLGFVDFKLAPECIDMQLGRNFDVNGLIFSPGQSQKVSIARTLLRNSPIIILDEPSSSMDAITENNIVTNVFGLASDKMLFFISHRLSNLKYVDRIMFLKDGAIVESGSHEELMKNKSYYYEMFNIQSQKYASNN